VNIASNIYDFSDYRQFLKDRYRQLKDYDAVFSFRSFSKDAGFGSPNYLKLVMDGKRNLSNEAIVKFAKGIRLDRHEAEFFHYLVSHNQCEDVGRKRVYEAKLTYLKELFKVKNLIPELYDYYHDWYHAAIREMIRKGGVRNEPATIAKSLVPVIKDEKASDSIVLLKKLGFVQESDSGNLEVTERTESLEAGVAQKIYQEQMAELAAQSIYTQDAGQNGFESVTVSLPANKIEKLKERIKDIVIELQEAGSSDPADAVYQFNVQLFALTNNAKKEKTEELEVSATGSNR